MPNLASGAKYLRNEDAVSRIKITCAHCGDCCKIAVQGRYEKLIELHPENIERGSVSPDS